MNPPRKQNGVALITAILVVATATALASALTLSQQLNIRRTSNLINGDQAWTYDEGAEAWIKQILRRDLKHSKLDYLGERWAQPLPPFQVPGGYITGQVIDMQGRFNINNLISQQGRIQTGALQRFQRLLAVLDINPALSQGVIDWLDPNVEATPPDGAEDNYYQGLKPPYRTANRLMGSASELRMVKGFTDKIYAKIAPYVCALPDHTAININTAPAQVLAALAPNSSAKAMSAVVARRIEKPFKSTQQISQSPILQSAHLDTRNLAVSSKYFLLRTEAKVATGRATMDSLILRAGKKQIRTIRRGESAQGDIRVVSRDQSKDKDKNKDKKFFDRERSDQQNSRFIDRDHSKQHDRQFNLDDSSR